MCGVHLNLTLGTRGGEPLHTGGLLPLEILNHITLGEALFLLRPQMFLLGFKFHRL